MVMGILSAQKMMLNFMGVKGGGNGNYGIITELKFKTHAAIRTIQSWRFKTYKIRDTAKARVI